LQPVNSNSQLSQRLRHPGAARPNLLQADEPHCWKRRIPAPRSGSPTPTQHIAAT